MNRLPLVGLFFLGAPLLLLASLQLTSLPTGEAGLTQSGAQKLAAGIKFISPEVTVTRSRVFAALPESNGEITFTINQGNARPLILHNYLAQSNSPLVGLEQEMVAAADTYDLDFRLLAAIARQESGLCQFIPPDGYNCWGWGIHERGTLGFASYQEAIWTVAQGLRDDYLNAGLATPEQIMTRYTPKSDGSWAAAVNQFMEEME